MAVGFIPATCGFGGGLLVITGHMGSGKTSIAVFLMEKARGYDIYTNVLFFDEDELEEAIAEKYLDKDWDYIPIPKRIHIVTKMSDLLIGLYNTPKNIIVLDEAALYAGYARGAMSKTLRWFKEFVTQIRKMNAGMILITQVKSDLVKMLRTQLEHYEIKMYKIGKFRTAKIAFLRPREQDDKIKLKPIDEWTNIQRGHYPYDTKAPASLEIDIDMEKFLTDISHLNSIELKKEVIGLIKKHKIIQKKKNPVGRPKGS